MVCSTGNVFIILLNCAYKQQVKVRDIHVRYEDHVTNPSTVLAAGITLHSLNLKVATK